MFAWDSDEELVTLTRAHVGSVLERYVRSELSRDEVGAWAEAIEGRDDIGLEAGHRDLLKSILFELANAPIKRRLSPLLARKLVLDLGRY
jgi:hypothetical protein